ncbi:MAG: Gfo/Idh/MocA family protein [Halanaerobiaceae bacterium]
MGNQVIKIGIIGAGQIANNHLSTYQEIDGVEIVAVADIKKEKAQKAAQKYDIENVFQDPRDMLEMKEIEAVDVCVHNNKHMPLTVTALQAGKDVYCEKPMAGSYLDAKKMLETARSVDQKLHIQLAMIFDTRTLIAQKLIQEGKLGDVYHARSLGFRRRGRPYVDGYGNPAFVNSYISGGGALYDMGVYHISRLLYLLDNPEVDRISGKIYQKRKLHEARRQKSGYDVEELGLGFVKFSDDTVLDIMESWAAHLDETDGSKILGSDGGLCIDRSGDNLEFFHTVDDYDADTSINLSAAEYRRKKVYEIGDIYDSPQHHWIRALQGQVELLPTAEIALNTMLIQQGIYLSDKLGREVTAQEINDLSESNALQGEEVYTEDEVLLNKNK